MGQKTQCCGAEQAAPVALTDEQIIAAASDAQLAYCLGKYDNYDVALARAVERAHGIGAEKGN